MPVMETSSLTAREYWEQVKARPNRAKFGFGKRPALLNIDVQRAYTDLDAFKTAYQTDPRQIEYINRLAVLFRERKLPVIWTHVAYLPSAEDAGVWGTRTDTVDSLQNIKHGSERAEFDPRAQIEPSDIVMHKRMASPFFETNLWSLLTFHHIDTLIITGGSTSGCVRACAIDSLSRGFRTTVVEECVADKHEIPHFANLADIMLKYADVESIATVEEELRKVSP
ncbi:isochorismatase family protein [Rhodanobacter sp. AS-Z3]|uniref:isochorismatase family protein n=1 Tax=Rhodanobacter sp. AS-Z3 TaxID=3031330 RepID=UPI00247A589F|nr:isochorismatase family protein [Rhodanobacter sp. AS-Z3]WEN14120.1 isochorismatase family protein [Rhodanobacter sp. AS-Z3]